MGKIKGMELQAIDEKGKRVEKFKVVWVGNLAFGEIGTGTTEKQFLELYDKQLQADIAQLEVYLNDARNDNAQKVVAITALETIRDNLKTKNKRLKQKLEKYQYTSEDIDAAYADGCEDGAMGMES